MKPHLPCPLYRALLSCLAAFAISSGSIGNASYLHPDVGIRLYTDFGQNCGRYSINSNALLDYIRQQEGGVALHYLGGQETYILPHGMIDYSSSVDSGPAAAVGYNYLATVQHNGVINATLSGNMIGDAYAIRYNSIEYRYSEGNRFLLTPDIDFKLERQSKLITDVTPSALYSNISAATNGWLAGQLLYFAGSGTMKMWNYNGSSSGLCGAYVYITGGISSIGWHESAANASDGSSCRIQFTIGTTDQSLINAARPLPFISQPGDSGAPAWVWNPEAEEYQYLAALYGGLDTLSQYSCSIKWAHETIASYNKTVDMAQSSTATVYINAVNKNSGVTYSDSTNGISTTPYLGSVTDSNGKQLCEFTGVQSGLNTWKSLNPVMNSDTWYTYDGSYLNSNASRNGTDLAHADLFKTENLVFVADSRQNNIKLTDNVDLGIGYVELQRGELLEADFTISSDSSRNDYMLNSAGYVVGEGVSLHLQLTNDADYAREWRKVGAGDLYIEGSGDNYIALNLGGSGSTYLQRENGYAAYNVLINNGATLVINDANQIARDLTFGNGGGTLDLNGVSMNWNTQQEVSAEGFSIHSLHEQGTIANLKSGSSSTLHYKQGGDYLFRGALQDNGTDSGLCVIVDGGAGSVLRLQTISTNLSSPQSGVTVASGELVLQASNTIHGKGSLNGNNAQRWVNSLDWHYSDARMNVEVLDGASFRLDSHSRLIGDVTVREGGLYVMKEGVQQRYEYVEGGYTAEDSNLYADYFGHKGNSQIDRGGRMEISFSEGTSSSLRYDGQISGEGSLAIRLSGHGSSLILGGDNSGFRGERSLSGGLLLAEGIQALGSRDQAWLVAEDAVLACTGLSNSCSSEEILSYIRSGSTGVLALTEDHLNGALVQDGLFIGALEGQTVHYGMQSESLACDNQGRWNLGGGGGHLIVDYLLAGDGELVIGNEYGYGRVTLANSDNSFSGNVLLNGHVELDYALGALGTAQINLQYGNAVNGSADPQSFLAQNIKAGSQGILLLDACVSPDAQTEGSFRFLKDNDVFLGAGSGKELNYTGQISAEEGAAFRFGGAGKLTLEQSLHGEGNNQLVLDGQGLSGGALELTEGTDITGLVTVMGYDSSKTTETQGDMELILGKANALASASGVLLKDGGILNIGENEQQLQKLETESGSIIQGAGRLVLTGDADNTMNAYLSAQNISKQGNGALLLQGGGDYAYMSVESGSLKLGATNSLSANGVTQLKNGSGLSTQGYSSYGTVILGSADAVSAAKEYIHFGSNSSFNGGIAVAEDAYLDGSGQIALNGRLEINQGATLELRNADYRLNNQSLNSSGGTISLADGHKLIFGYVSDNSTQSLDGTLHAANAGQSATLQSLNSTVNNVGIRIRHLDIGGGSLNLSQLSWNTRWEIQELSGSGTLNWEANTNHYYSSSLKFSGEGNFDGIVNFHANKDNAARAYQKYLEIASEKALSHATLIANGNSANSMAAVALNAERVELAALEGNANSCLYAGSPIQGTGSDSNSPMAATPLSSRNSELLISGSGNHDFAGNINASTDGQFLVSLSMQGSGSQSFSGSGSVGNLNVQSGTLSLGNGIQVAGDILLAQGATLQYENLSLNAGQQLSVLDNSQLNSGSASLGGTLSLNGGSLSFDGSLLLELGSNTAALSISGYSGGEGALSLTIANAGYLKEGSYRLISGGDWSSYTDSAFSLGGLDYMNASLQGDSNGLSLILSNREGSFIWAGTNSQHEWNSELFGSSNILPSSKQTATFNDSAANKQVLISSDAEVAAMNFNNTEDYRFSSANGSSINSNSLYKEGSGCVYLDSGVNILGDIELAGGELVLGKGASVSGSIRGNGTLGFDVHDGDISDFVIDEGLKNLHIISGSYVVSAANPLHNTLLRVEDGGQVYISSGQSCSNDFVLAGSGWNEAAQASERLGALRLDSNSRINGLISLSADASLYTAGGSTICKLNTGAYTLHKWGKQELQLGGTDISGSIDLHEGSIRFNGGSYSKGLNLHLEEGSSILLAYNAALIGSNDIRLENGSAINLQNGNLSNALTADIHVISGTACLNGSWQGNNTGVHGNIDGKGTLLVGTVTSGQLNRWTLNSSIRDGANEGDSLALRFNSYVTVNGNNSYSGGSTLEGKTLTTGNLHALGTGRLSLQDGTLSMATDLALNGFSGSASAIQLNGHTLYDNEAENRSYSGALGGGSFAKSGAGTLSMNISGDCSLTQLSVQGGGLELLGSGACTLGSSSIGEGASLSIGSGWALTLNSVISNRGTLLLDCSQISSNAILSADADYTDSKAPNSGNGFTDKYWLVRNDNDSASVSVTAESVQLGDKSYTLHTDASGCYYLDRSVYNIAKGQVIYGDTASNSAMDESVRVLSLHSNAVLSLSEGLKEGVGIYASEQNCGVEIQEGVLLQDGSLSGESGSSLILRGKGDYLLSEGQQALRSGISLGGKQDWQGCVQIHGAAFQKNLAALNALGNENSRISLSNSSVDYSNTVQNNSLNTQLVLESGDALNLNNLAQGGSIAFNKSISGSGNLLVSGNSTDGIIALQFKGDCSDWNGTLALQASDSGSASYSVLFNGSAELNNALALGNGSHAELNFKTGDRLLINTVLDKGAGQLDIVLSGAGEKILSAAAQADSLRISGGSASFLSEDSSFKSLSLAAQTELRLENGATMQSGLGEGNSLRIAATDSEGARIISTAEGSGTGGSGLQYHKADLLLSNEGEVVWESQMINSSLRKLGGGSLDIAGDIAEHSSLELQAGSVQLSAAQSSLDSLSLQSGSSLRQNEGNTLRLGSCILNAGTLELNGLLDGSLLSPEDGSYCDTLAPNSGNGFAGLCWIVRNSDGGKLTLGSSQILANGQCYDIVSNAEGAYFQANDLYHVATGEVRYGDASNSAQSAAQLQVHGGATLSLAKDLATGSGILLRDRARLNLERGVRLHASSLQQEGQALLSGEGRYISRTASLGMTLAENWNGCIELEQSRLDGQTLNKETYGENLALNGVSGRLDSENVHDANIELMSGDALTLTEARQGREHSLIFSGRISGEGSIRQQATASTAWTSAWQLEFCGDVSGWSGSFICDTAADSALQETKLLYSGQATKINNRFQTTLSGQKLSILIDNNADVELYGSFSGAGQHSLELSGLGCKSIHAAQELADARFIGGAVVLGADMSISHSWSGDAALQLQQAKLSLNGSNNSAYRGEIRMDAGSSILLTDSTLAANISGEGSLISRGDSSLSGQNSFLGGLSVESGCLNASGSALGTGSLHIAEGASLYLSGPARLSHLSGAGDFHFDGQSLNMAIAEGEDVRFDGEMIGGSLSKTGAGSLSLGSLSLTDEFSLCYEGNLQIDSLSLGDGIRLNYSNYGQEGWSVSQINADMLQGSVALNVDSVGTQFLRDGIDLHISSGVSRDLILLSNGSNAVSLSEQNGNWFLQANAVDWDANWGEAGLAHASAVPSLMAISSTKNFAGMNAIDNGTDISVHLTGAGNSSASIFAAMNSDTNSGGGTTKRNTWLYVEGGSYDIVAGGSHCNNWQTGSVWNLTGDTHIQLDGASVNHVIGGNHKDGKSPVFNGDSYISVLENAEVNGCVVGSGTNCHTVTQTQNGSSHIYIYNIMNANSASLNGIAVTGSVVGGSLKFSNVNSNSVLNGGSHILIDLSNYSGSRTDFGKQIIGGHYTSGNINSQSISGGSELNILCSGKTINFFQMIIGGNYISGSGSSSLQGGSRVTLEGGRYNGVVFAGSGGGNASVDNSYLSLKNSRHSAIVSAGSYASGNSVISGCASLSMENSSSMALVNGAGVLRDANGVISTGSVEMRISGSSLSNELVGGIYEGVASSAAKSQSVGDISLRVDGGSSIGTLLGGSSANNSNSSSSISQGNIRIALEDCTLNGDLYAAGSNSSAAKLSSASTRVEIGDKVTGTSGKVISGGYRGSGNNSVSGNRTLAFSGNSVSTGSYNADFRDFDHLEVGKAETVVTLDSNFQAGSTLHKQGSGTLRLNTAIHNAVVEAGTLQLQADGEQQVESVTLQEGGSLSIAAGDSPAAVIGSLSAQSGSSLNYEAAGTALFVNGAASLSGDVNIHLGAVAAGSYNLIQAGSSLSLEGTRHYDILSSNQAYSLSESYNEIKKSLSLEVRIDANGWNGSAGKNAWNSESGNSNWLEGGSASSFSEGENALFGERSGNIAADVHLENDVTAGGVIVLDDYSFEGQGSCLTAQALSIADGKTLSVTGEGLELNTDISGGKLQLGSGDTACATITANGHGESYSMKGASLNAKSQSLTGGKNATLENVLLDIAEGCSLRMENILISATSRITDAPATLEACGVQLQVQEGVNATGNAITLPSETQLQDSKASSPAFSLGSETSVYNVVCSSMDTVTLSGESICIDFSSYSADFLATLSQYSYVAFSLSDGSNPVTWELDELSISATANGEGYAEALVSAADAEAKKALVIYFATEGLLSVPEPTGSTLALLALAALATRRRREA